MKLPKTIYHVARGHDGMWDGGDLEPLATRLSWSDETHSFIADRWPDCDPWTYYCTEGCFVHFHETLAEALEFADEEGGQVLEIDSANLIVGVGEEYPHPVVRGTIPAGNVVGIH